MAHQRTRTTHLLAIITLLLTLFATSCGDDEVDDKSDVQTTPTSSTSSTSSDTSSNTSQTTTEPDVGVDTGQPDTEEEDTGTSDVGDPDTNPVEDTGTEDTSDEDTGQPDTGTDDVGEPDTGTDDVGEPDTPAGPLYVSDTAPDSIGPLAVENRTIAQGSNGAPTDMVLTTPNTPGTYAVLIFQHGFLMANTHYGELLRHVASHGFIVVAPQMYTPGGLPFGQPTTPEEVALAANNLTWLPQNLSNALPNGVIPSHEHTGLSGHSRGSKVIWSLLSQDPSRALAVAGVDPVDGTGGPFGGEERVIQGPFTFNLSSLIIGTGLGPVESGPFQPACAPAGDNHQTFYDASPSPAWHIIASDFGHNDMLDDSPPGCGLECTACPGGSARQPMRVLTAGALTAFFSHTLQGNPTSTTFLDDPQNAVFGAVVTESR